MWSARRRISDSKDSTAAALRDRRLMKIAELTDTSEPGVTRRLKSRAGTAPSPPARAVGANLEFALHSEGANPRFAPTVPFQPAVSTAGGSPACASSFVNVHKAAAPPETSTAARARSRALRGGAGRLRSAAW